MRAAISVALDEPARVHAIGEIVGYLDRHGQERSGRVTRLKDKTVSLTIGDQHWRVADCFLHRVMEADIVEAAARLI